MGNTESNVTSGVKKQTDSSSILLYKLVDLKGGGLLVDMMKRATQTKQYAELDHALRTKVEPYLYNKGKGKWIPIEKLVLLRNKDRPKHKMLPPLRAMENPADYDIDKDMGEEEVDETKIGEHKSKYRLVCWSLSQRGAVGETIMHLCMLHATAIHTDLAKRLLRFYPKLINDIYISDEYYGENALHIAIVNEDPAMVKFLLDSGADVHERCVGNFMCPEDQKASRTDSVDHEWVCVAPETNYSGYVYWGEYPLNFAACLGQEECYRLILARGADPDKQDTNGNTVLHMLVIYEKMATFDMAYEVGASLSIRNAQHLTPLTLSAKLARIEMFFHILNIEREIYWQIGSITCAAYPLSQVDTIDVNTGSISHTSALNLVVFGEKDEHLELMDGTMVDLLNAKWNTFVKSRFYRQFFLFCFYFILYLISFTLRPGPSVTSTATTAPTTESTTPKLPDPPPNFIPVTNQKTFLEASLSSSLDEIVTNALNLNFPSNATARFDDLKLDLVTHIMSNLKNILNGNETKNEPFNSSQLARFDKHLFRENDTDYSTSILNETADVDSTTKFSFDNSVLFEADNKSDWWTDLTTECRLMQLTTASAKIRLIAEIFMEIAAILYILAALREARFLGLNMFIENLMTVPSRVMFLFSCCILLSFPFLRLSCADEVEDVLAVVVMLTTAPYFLFFCRGFKTVGPFVVMIYRMIMGDLLRFVSIYLVFVIGFSQAYYIIFLSFDNPNTPEGVDDSVSNPMPSPIESIMAMFLMSMTNFGDYYGAFERTRHEMEAKFLFVVYMAIVAILLVNMLIAMMGNTYQKIAETRNEWQRQWARIVLVVERGVSPQERLKKLMDYSQPMSDGRRALVLRLNQSEEDKEEMKEILEMKRTHERLYKKRQLKTTKEKTTITEENVTL
nr:PREDICTED: transient receptor potential cation channel subfamily V member 5 isoform X2 [Megachile rotundata]XP_012147392.1 PREDICTED: transient receptor potential cation channel subfamily V member 5 isoform X2 [Megachile rotundata]XP_012147393.1 PREDICTED: transient receptor potential cation channel subfamily V member 5 isoform X2 [Megachile rotundata]XP_012147394.1 PREDICTED: transient receptor potential cation channel subfamily V member 5 isoform X2 [Megachile rotundata]XP_012147395.1 PRED